MVIAGIVCAIFASPYVVAWLPGAQYIPAIPRDSFFWFGWTWFAFCIPGLVFAGIARARNERMRWLTITGFVLNGLLPGTLFIVIVRFLMGWVSSVINDLWLKMIL